MGQTEYIVRFKGDYSALAKDLKQIGAATKQIADDEVIIKLHYDGNIKEFNKTFDTISKMHPELGIQFQYNVNEKLLNQELEKLKGITELQLDIDEGKVRDKLQNLGNSVETAFNEGLSKDEITKRVKQFFGYYNTATKAGVKDISKLFYGIRTRIYDALKSDNHISIFDDLIDADERKSFELFKIDKSLKDDLVDTQNRVNDIKNTLKSLEEKGASKTGLPSELQKVQDEIKILRSDIEEMKGDLKNLSGDAFDAMTQQIKDTNEQLRNALELVKELKTTLSDNGITKNNSVGNVIKQWQKEKETQTNERYTAFNSQSKQTSGAHLAADAEGVSMKLIRSAIDEMGDEADGTIHSHPMKFAAFSDDDIERYFNLFEDTQGKIFSHAVTSAEQAISIDMSKIDTSKKKDILSFIKEEYSNIDNQLIGDIGSKSKELKNTVNTILEKYQNNNESNPQIKELVNNIQQGVDVMFANLGDVFSYEDFADSFDSLLGNSAKQTAKDLGAKTVDDLKSMLQRFMPNIGEIMESVEDAVLIPLNNQAQQAYQSVLQKVFTNPKFLKSGETSAIKIEALSDFIDWGSIEQSAKEASQKAADALREAQDSNSPAELTKPLGKDFGLGYAEGIREAMPEIVNACKEVVLAAYNALKESNISENTEDVNSVDSLADSFKDSLEKSKPLIQEKIKGLFSAFDMGDGENPLSDFGHKFADILVKSIRDGLDGEYNIQSLGKTLETLLNSAFEKAVLDTAVQSIVDNIQKSLDDMTSINPIQIKYFEPQTDSLIFEIESALENHKFNVNLGGTIKDLSTALNTSADNVRMSFLDALKWMREADRYQEEHKVRPRERKLYFNTKTGQFSNPSIYGGDHSTPGYLNMASEYKKKGVVFDADLHTHLYDKYAFPSSLGNAAGGGRGDIDNFFQRAYNSALNNVYETLSKFIVGAKNEYVEFDFSKIASTSKELEDFLINWLSNNISQVTEVLGSKADNYLSNPREVAGLYVGNKLLNLARKKKEESGYTPHENVEELLKAIFIDYNDKGLLTSQVTGEKQSLKDIFDEELPVISDVRNLFDTMPNLLKQMLDTVVRRIKLWIQETAGLSGDINVSTIDNAIDDALSSTLVEGKFSKFNNYQQDFKKVLRSYFVGEFTEGSGSVYSDKTWDQFGSEALHELIDTDELIGKIVKYYTPDELEKKYKGSFSKQKIDAQSQSSPTLPEDFQQQLQNAVDATGEYIIKVYGELVENFKSRLQNAIDESGLYHVDIEGWLHDTFHNNLQRDIDDQEKYYIEVKGRLIETFKDALQGLIDNLGAFPIQVKPFVRKGEEIEEVDLPGGNQNNLLSGTTTPSQQFDNEVQQNLVMLENYKNTVAEIDRLKLEPETDETKVKLEELNKLADYFASKITVIRSENGGEVNTSMMLGWGASGGWSERLKRDYSEEQRKDFLNVAKDRTGLQISKVASEFHGISDEISNIEAKSEGLRNALTKDLTESSAYVSKLRAAYLGIAEANDELKTAKPGSEDFKDYTEQLNILLSKHPELEKFKDALGYYDKAPEFVKSDEWLDFLATLPQAHTYLESIGYDFDKINRASNETPVSTESTNAETKALLSKKEVVEQLRTELNLTKKAAEELFEQQDYTKTNSKYQIEQEAVDSLIASLKEKQEVEKQSESIVPTTSPVADNIQSEVDTVNQAIDAEKKKFDELKNKISKTIPKAIETKNEAFKKEADLVSSLVGGEVKDIDNLKDSIDGVGDAVKNQANNTSSPTSKPTTKSKPKDEYKQIKKDAATRKAESEKQRQTEINNLLDKQVKAYQKVLDIRKKIAKLDPKNNAEQIKVLEAQKQAALKEYAQQTKDLKKLDESANSKAQSSTLLNMRKSNAEEIATIQAQKVEKAYGDAENKANGLLEKVKKLRESGKYTQDFVDELNSAEVELRSFLDDLTHGKISFENLDDRIKVLSQNIEGTLSQKAFGNVKKAAEKSLTNVGLKIDQIIAKNSAMGKEFEARFMDLRNSLGSAQTVDEVKRIIAEVNKLESELIQAGKTGKSFIDQIKQRLRDINSKYIAQYFSFQDIIRYARQAAQNIIQLNDAFIELSKVSDTSLEALEKDFKSYADIAKGIGGTITDTISATADWARLGYDVPDSKKLAEVAMLYKNVGDGIDIDTANQSLISTLRGFKLEAEDAISIVDKFNEVSNNFAISSGGIGESLQRSAAAFSAANTDLSQSIALVTATNEVVQDPDAVGSMWTTVSARIRGAKTELEDMGEDTDDMVESTSKLRDLVKGITGVDIMLNENTFKDIYTIITQIGDKWNDINDIDQAALLEALAGKRQANRLAAVLGNLDHLKEAYQTAEESAGSAQREQENFQKGLTYSINQAKAALEELSFNAINSDFLKGLINTGTKAINLVSDLIDKFGLLKTAIIGISTVWGSRKLGLFDFNEKGSILGKNGLGGLISNFKNNKQNKIDSLYLSDLIKDIKSGNGIIGDDWRQTINWGKAQKNLGISDEVIESVVRIGEEYKTAGKQIDALKAKMGDLSSAGVKVANVLKSIGSTILNGLLSAGISIGITGLISTVSDFIDHQANASKYIQQSAKKARDAISEIQKEFKDTVETVDNVKQHYAELAQEVNHLGTVAQSQGTLSNDEYKEFLDISNQLSELFPTLTQGYDENGNAILKLSGDVDNVVGSLERLVEVERQVANANIAKQLPNDWAGYVDDLQRSNIHVYEEMVAQIGAMKNGSSFTVSDDAWSIIFDALQSANIDNERISDIRSNAYYHGDKTTFNLDDVLSPDEITAFHNALTTFETQYTRYINQTEASLESKTNDFYNNILSQFTDDEFYKNLDEPSQKVFQGLLKNYDYEALADQFGDDWNGAFKHIQDELITKFNNISSEDKEKINTYYNELFAIDTSEGVFAENIEQIKQYIQELADLLGIEYIDLANIFGLGDIDSDINRVKDAFIVDDSSSETNLGYISFDPRKQKAEQQAKQEYENFIDSLSKEDFDFWKAALDDDKIPQEVLHNGEQALKDYLEELQKVAENNEIKIKASAAVDSMADMKSAVASLSDLYNQSVLQLASENADNFATFAADPATLNSIESAFNKFIEEKSSSGSDVSELNAALDEFERISVEAYGTEDYSEQMQKAIDNLITAYIDQTDVIKNLTEENAKWSEEQLRAMGIENADAIVMAKLSKKTKELMTSVTKLAKAYDKLDDMQVGSEEYSKGLEEIASAVKDMLDLGDVADDFNISTGFVTKNLDLIKEAAAGSGEAINQLRKEAAKEITTQIHIEGNPQEVMGYQSEINRLIDNFDIENIEVGTRLDKDPMILGLNDLVEAGKITRDSMNAILAGIGVVPDIQGYEEIPITMENLHSAVAATGARGTAAAQMEQAMRNNSNAVVRLPKFGYKLASKGTTANYSAPSTSGSSGGGGGGGGDSEPTKPKEESEETFDWIEVAIQRIEEEISRLDKVVGNSYDLWINRNEALVKEMEKTTEEIKAQQLAQSEYLRNANAVQVNNGKGLNDDDYGENDELVKANDQKLLDEARAAWATGEYQRKVREGQMSGDDIEKIQNHFLSETIQFYQELYNKSVAAGDAVQDLQIKLGELARTNFDHVKSEYEELIQYITDSADIINEKINRTEEHGYFVSKSYYQDLLKLESGNLAYLEGEYEDLIKKRDEAVAAGYIAESSSEWNQMNQEINAVNKSIEESKTKTVELNNAIRQLEWDRFDWLEDRISKINEEASFLIDLMSNDQLYEDNGKLTGLGHSTNAMYAVQYETYMRQARDYAEERKKLEKEMAADPANKNLVERYEDLVAAQQDAIKGAEQMKDAVKSLVEEGFNRFLSSLQKLIDEYKKAQTEAKD